MILGRARSLSLVLALMSCSTDTQVVATHDASAGEGGAPGAAQGGSRGGDEHGGAGGDTVGGGGGDERGGAGGRGGDALGGIENGGSGTGLVTELEGEPTTSVCACVGSASFVCGADGVTYDPSCASGCNQVVIACLHACPCVGATGEGGANNSTEWVDERCFDPGLCPSGSICFSSAETGPSRPCGP